MYRMISLRKAEQDRFFFFFQAEDGIRDLTVTGVRRVLFRSAVQDIARSASRGFGTHGHETRLRIGRMRGLRCFAGRQGGAFLLAAGGRVRQEEYFDGGRPRYGREAASAAGGVCGFGSRAVRLLHAGNFGDGESAVGSKSESFEGSDSRSAFREFVPVHGLSADFRGGGRGDGAHRGAREISAVKREAGNANAG